MDAEENPSSEEERNDGSDASEFTDEAPVKREYTDEAAVQREYTDEAAVKTIKILNNRVQKLDISAGQIEKYQYGAQYLLQELINVLSEYNTKFLTDYLDVLKSNNMSAISWVTGDIISAIEMIISKEKEGRTLKEPVMVVLVSWLCASMLWNAPRVPFARPALHALLPLLTENEAQRVADAWEKLAQPAALLELSDAAAGAGALGARLLRAAGLAAAGAGDELLRLRVRGRSLHAGDAAGDLTLPTLSEANTVAEIQKVLVISKLHKIFGKDPDNIVMSGSDSQGTADEVTNV